MGHHHKDLFLAMGRYRVLFYVIFASSTISAPYRGSLYNAGTTLCCVRGFLRFCLMADPIISLIPDGVFVFYVTTPRTPLPELSGLTIGDVLSSFPRARVSVSSLPRCLDTSVGPSSSTFSLGYAVKPLCYSLCVSRVSFVLPLESSLGEKVSASVPLWGSPAVNVGRKGLSDPRDFTVSFGYLYI